MHDGVGKQDPDEAFWNPSGKPTSEADPFNSLQRWINIVDISDPRTRVAPDHSELDCSHALSRNAKRPPSKNDDGSKATQVSAAPVRRPNPSLFSFHVTTEPKPIEMFDA